MAIAERWTRRQFMGTAAAGLTVPLIGRAARADSPASADYAGPNVVVVRFGGGVRRRETIDLDHTWAPYFRRELVPRGTLFPMMDIAQLDHVETSHGQGTLYILTGRYDRYVDVEQQFLASRFVPQAPTIFEYFRRAYNVPDHQALIVNGEDRTQEEFYTFSNNHLFGVDYRSEVLSLYRYKVYRLEQQLASGTLVGDAREQAQKNLAELYTHDYRGTEGRPQATEVQAFWDRWREFYSDDPNRSARGDRLLTTLSLRALRDLHPRLLMINYNDPDYVHWGKSAHYFEGIKVIDEGLRQLVWFLEHDEFYAGNTVLFVVPDCGRDTNRFVPVPFQHHFGTKSSHEIWAFAMGPGIARNVVVDKPVDQISLAATIGQTMGFDPSYAEGPVLEEAFA